MEVYLGQLLNDNITPPVDTCCFVLAVTSEQQAEERKRQYGRRLTDDVILDSLAFWISLTHSEADSEHVLSQHIFKKNVMELLFSQKKQAISSRSHDQCPIQCIYDRRGCSVA